MHGFFSSLPISHLLRQLGGLACSALLVACGSSGGGSTPSPTSTPASLSGTFIDSPVDGLRYTTTSNPGGGFTSGGGHFACQPGDLVTFWIGSRQIGSPQLCSSDPVTAVSVLGASSVTDPQVVNLAQLLMTLGPIVNNVIQIPQPLPAGFNSALVPAFTDPNFDTAVLAALPVGTLLVSNAQATLQLQASLKMLTVTIINGGSVTSAPTGILNCTAVSGTCSAAFQTGAVVTLTATGNGFTGWSGGTGSVSCTGAGTCASTLDADSSVTATFPVAPPPATLSISNAGTGTGHVNCSVSGGAFGACAPSYPNGTALTLQGVADAGSTFIGWSTGTGNISCSGINNCDVTLTANSTVTANFSLPVQVLVTVNLVSANAGGGTVQCSANGGAAGPCASYPVGTPLSIIPTPNPASNFSSWTNGTGSLTANCGGATGACSFTLTATTSITANFNRPTLMVVVNGTGSVSSNPIGINTCTTNCSAPFDKGAVTLTASGGGFTGWSGGACSGTGTCLVTLNTDMTVTANFGSAGLPSFAVAALEAYLKASNTGAGDQFGVSVTLSGDTLAIGAWQEDSAALGINGNQADNSAAGSGAVYVFTRTGGVWSQQAYLKASNAGAGDNFGVSVVLAGDTLAVGAYREDSAALGINGNQADNSAADSGAVYVFTRTGGVWSQQAYLKASNTGANDWFGISVALDSDTLAVGAQSESSAALGINGNQADNSAAGSGAVYVFTRTGGVWSQQAYLKASNTGAGDQFGNSVALSGDTLAVGAYIEDSAALGINGNQTDNSAADSGAVYVFTRTGGVWSQQAYLKASNTGAGDQFGGGTIALAGDTLAVGAWLEDSAAVGVNGNQADNSAADSGAVYVFTRTGGVWSQQAYLKASNTGVGGLFGDQFGVSVALTGDTLAVAAQAEDSAALGINGNQADNSAADSGAVYVFTRTGGVWSQQAYLKASNTGAGDQFGGGTIALSGNTLVVPAYLEGSAAIGVNGNQANNSAAGSGAIFVYRAQ